MRSTASGVKRVRKAYNLPGLDFQRITPFNEMDIANPLRRGHNYHCATRSVIPNSRCGMFLDARSIPSHAVMDSELCIVGRDPHITVYLFANAVNFDTNDSGGVSNPRLTNVAPALRMTGHIKERLA
jgi:hypothetical protein